MTRPLMLVGLFIASVAGVGEADGQENRSRTYQRRPVERPQPYPRYYPRSAVQAGAFQRPYPYHLDYYRKQYGGGYEPYFGNLYGPPRIVGTQPFAFSQYPNHEPNAYHTGYPRLPLAAPIIECPHCQQSVQLQWQAAPTETIERPAEQTIGQ